MLFLVSFVIIIIIRRQLDYYRGIFAFFFKPARTINIRTANKLNKDKDIKNKSPLFIS